MLLSERPPWCFSKSECHRLLLKHFETSTLDGFDVEADSPRRVAAGAPPAVRRRDAAAARPRPRHQAGAVPPRANLLIDEATRRSLELTRTLRDGKRDGTLLSVIDETKTPMGRGAPRLRAEQSADRRRAIDRRLDAVGD